MSRMPCSITDGEQYDDEPEYEVEVEVEVDDIDVYKESDLYQNKQTENKHETN